MAVSESCYDFEESAPSKLSLYEDKASQILE